MFNGNLNYDDVLRMPTDMRLNYIKYVSDQYEKRKNKMDGKVENMNPDRGNEMKKPFDNVKNNS